MNPEILELIGTLNKVIEAYDDAIEANTRRIMLIENHLAWIKGIVLFIGGLLGLDRILTYLKKK